MNAPPSKKNPSLPNLCLDIMPIFQLQKFAFMPLLNVAKIADTEPRTRFQRHNGNADLGTSSGGRRLPARAKIVGPACCILGNVDMKREA